MSAASKLKNSLESSRSFLRRLQKNVRAKKNVSNINTKAKAFTFDQDAFPVKSKKEMSSMRWYFLMPFVLIVGFGGFMLLTLVLTAMFLLHGVKLLWEGYSYKSIVIKKQKISLQLKSRCRQQSMAHFRKKMTLKNY